MMQALLVMTVDSLVLRVRAGFLPPWPKNLHLKCKSYLPGTWYALPELWQFELPLAAGVLETQPIV